MLSDMSMRSCVYMLLFLVLVVNFNQFGSYTLFLYLPVLMRSWFKYQTVDRSYALLVQVPDRGSKDPKLSTCFLFSCS